MKKHIRNKELSWLSFNARLLQEADKPEVPLLERMRFLGIYSNNMDEFFRVRVAILKRLALVNKLTLDEGNEPKVILRKIEKRVKDMGQQFSQVYRHIVADLQKQNIYIINETQLNEQQAEFVKHYFHETVRPKIFPLILRRNIPLPSLKDDAFYLGIAMWTEDDSSNEYALIEVPTHSLDRFILLPHSNGQNHIIILEDIIRARLQDIFYMFEFNEIEAFAFKLTRDAELDINDDVDISYVKAVEESLERRKVAPPVRFVHDSKMPPKLLKILEQKLGVRKQGTKIAGGRYHNSKDFMNFPTLGRDDLLYGELPPIPHRDLKPNESILNVIRHKDILLHFPYHPFLHVIDLLREAAIDAHVKEIKITIYRVARQSSVMNALINAARNGKKVTVLMELRARFDEKSNIKWSERLREEGIKVILGVVGFKVHSKLVLITREERGKTRHYSCMGTGNFNEETASVFSDHLLCTSHPELGKEVGLVFDFFERNYRVRRFKHLLVSPFFMRNRLVRMINREIRNAQAGKTAYIYLKVNNLVDVSLIYKLYDAKKKGVDVRLNVRGMFSVYPTFNKKENNIPSIGLIDRYLEHSRIFIFGNDGNEAIYLSSADLMARNMDRRVEVAAPVWDPELKEEIRTMWDYQWQDNSAARILDNELSNQLKTAKKGKSTFRSQVEFYSYIKKRHSQ